MTTDAPVPWVEIRVHGVSGTPPQSFLETKLIKQVNTDSRSQFWQRHDGAGNLVRDQDGRVLEAYHWGRFTAGSFRQALWLLLVAFGVINAAQYMLYRPRSGGLARVCYAVASGLLRVVGYALTLLLVLVSCVIAMDLLAWQTLGADQPSRWLVAAGLVPVAIIGLAIVLGRADAAHRPLAPRDVADAPSDFAKRGFYQGDIRSPDLWMLHASGGVAFVAWIIEAAVPSDLEMARWVVVAALVLVLLLGDPEQSASATASERASPVIGLWHRVLRALVWVVLASALLIFVLALRDVWVLDVGARSSRTMPGIDRAALSLITMAVVALALLAVANLALAITTHKEASTGRPPKFARYLRGMFPSVAVAVGIFLAIGLTAASALLGRVIINLFPGQVDAPQVVERAAYAWGLVALEVLVLVVVIFVSRSRHRAHHAGRADRMFAVAHRPLPQAVRTKLANAMFWARLKNDLARLLLLQASFGLLLALAAGLELARFSWSDFPRVPFDAFINACDPDLPACTPSNAFGILSENDVDHWLTSAVMWIGVVFLVALAAGLFYVVLSSRELSAGQRGLGILWDVISFWPRSAHPGVPPPYSLRVVTDLAERIGWHLGEPTRDGTPANPEPASKVILCGHSQGSLISFAALFLLRPSLRDRVGLVTFGSQLRLMFPRAFPSYVNFASITWLREQFGDRWVNLYRETDPLAGPVLSWDREGEGARSVIQAAGNGHATSYGVDALETPRDDWVRQSDGARRSGPDWRLLDPSIRMLEDSDEPGLRGHADFFRDRAWNEAVRAVDPPDST